MSRKINKEFKERILNNKVKAESKYKEKIKENSIVTVELEENNLIAKVDRGNLFVDSREVRELIKDIFYTNAELKENTVINLDNICDVCYKLSYKGKVNNEVLFSLC
ncbi:hypothetical protein [Clostridium sp.]|uniref:hypothetical protein n=1 Tax=Clostridium sp. TaxID=1506 RepID=UPI001DC2E37A|nr:hypothetical protein [Clostridium sp.]MBS5307717.1 hypothetical protein [Clostridium sp.]